MDQCIGHFKRNGLPDLIHGHYADAGYAGAQLARLLHVPFVFTGHSLGRVKRQRLIDQGGEKNRLNRKYHFRTRIEAEEVALETASMVVTSTSQEVEQQYELYDHYTPNRMEVIPPGVNLDAFQPPSKAAVNPRAKQLLEPFLRDPDKPIILAMARPDERKNLESLVRVYGENEDLQRLANLVIVMGTRDDVRSLPKAQRKVIRSVLTLIDVYDLYGKVAYPKQHLPSDVPELYRLAAASRGVFVNPALTEPFGLTLLEAAGSGVPIVATNDGGPRDIVANCQNGLLIDPLNDDEIAHALTRVLTEPEEWEQWSDNGLRGVNQHYAWKQHADRYVRDVIDILDHAEKPALRSDRQARRLPDFDRMIFADLDNTLTGDSEALEEFNDLLRSHDHIGFGISTGRNLEDARQLVAKLGLPTPDVLDTSVGTQLHYGEDLVPDKSWQQQIGFRWNREAIESLLSDVTGLFLQAPEEQSEFKISYRIDPSIAPRVNELKKMLRAAKLRAKVILSLGAYLDVIPVRGGSDLSIRHLLFKWGFAPEQLLVAGDSGNDEGMLKGRALGVVVGNYSPELEKLRKHSRVYFADGKYARGVLEGIKYYNFLDKITIPNERAE